VDFLQDNWAVIAPLVVAAMGLFWPQLKPIIDPIINPKPTPSPVDPGPLPGPDPVPSPRPGVNIALQLAMALLQAMLDQKNKEGADFAREAAKAIIDQEQGATK